MARIREEYNRRRLFIQSSLNEMGLPTHDLRGSFYAFPYVGDCGLSSYDFAMQLLEEENVACVPGTAFGACGEGFLRCSYATSLAKIEQAMERMERFVTRLRNR